MLGITDYAAFVAAFFILLILPGPGTIAVLASTGKGGIRGGVLATLGIIAGDQVLLWLAAAGVAAILHARPIVFQGVQWLGAGYLVWLGAQMALAKPGAAKVLNIQPYRYFQQGALVTILNPKAIVFYMAFFPQFIDPETHRGLLTFTVMAVTVAVMTLIYCFGLVLLTRFFAERFRSNPTVVRWLERGAGICLVGFGIKLLFAR